MEMPSQISPPESFISTPGDNYSSLFPVSSPSANTVNPMDMMTPQSSRQSPGIKDEEEDDEDEDGTPAPEDSGKPTKKRKSWGQVLPEPKTNLPPRKRAKTDDEKEQRRVERVLRNRRAAQSSRERKRLEVEALEERNKQLEDMLVNAQKANQMLVEELTRFRRDNGSVDRSSSDPLRDNVTLSQELFSSQGGLKCLDKSSAALMSNLMNPTVNPASLSPELGPVDSADLTAEPSSEKATSSEQTLATSPDVTQHPAEMLSFDLPCHMSAEVPKSFLASQTSTTPLLALSPLLRMMLLSASTLLSACQRPLTQIAMSSRAGFSLLPTPQLLTTIIWLLTLPPASPPSTSTTSSPTTQATSTRNLWQRATTSQRTTASPSRSLTLRLKSLRKILSSSPNLARPLMDATMVALRLVSEGRDDRVETLRRESLVTRDDVDRELIDCLSGIALPSREVLLTLLWALKVEERRASRRMSDAVLDPETSAPDQQPFTNIELKVAGVKRRRHAAGGNRATRFRMA